MKRNREDEKRELSHLAARAHRRVVRRRWARRSVIGLALLVMAVVAAAYAARGPLTRGVALATIEEALGYEASAGSARLVTGDTVRLPDLVLRAPGVAGEAGVVLRAERVDLEVDWLLAAVRPADAVRSISLHRPTARASIDVETGALSVTSRRRTEPGGAFPRELPPIRVEDAVLELGEHGAGWFAALHRIRVTGVLAPPAAGSEVYALRLTEEVDGARTPAVLEGELDLRRGAGDLALTDVDFGALQAQDARVPVRTPLRRLRVDGRLPLATLRFEPDGTYVAQLELDGVDVRVPAPVLNPEAAGGDETRPLDLTGVTGEVVVDPTGLSANLIGLFGDIDARVVVATDGFGAGADLSAEFITSDYRLGPNPALLPYAPELAAEFLRRFSGPEAEVSGRVRLERRGGETAATGLFAWTDGSAAFEGFPYPIQNISGQLSFDSERIHVRDLRGEGPTGARITAEISAAPIGEDAEIDADIVATGVPVDEHLLGAIQGERGEAVAALFDASGLPEEARALLPAGYEAGGEVRLEILVTKRGGEEGEWNWDVLATSDRLEVAAGALGYPATARDFRLRLDRFNAKAELPVLEGPTGATGSATVSLRLKDERGDSAFRPSVMFEVERAPIDSALVAAARKRSERAAAWLERLGATGSLSARGEASTEDGELSLRLDGEVDDVRLRTGGERFAELDGTFFVSDREIRATAEGAALGGRFEGWFERSLAGGAEAERGGGEWRAHGAVRGLELREDLASVVALFDESGGERLREAAERWRPAGAISLEVSASGGGDGAGWEAAIGELEGASAEVGGERVTVRRASGGLRVVDSPVRAEFRGFEARVSPAEGSDVALRADGTLRLAEEGESSLSLEAEGLRFESPVVRRVAEAFGGEAAQRLFAEADPAGEGELSVRVEAADGEASRARGAVRPSRLMITRNDERLEFESVQGEVRFGGEGPELSGLIVERPGWRAMLTGRFLEGEFSGEVDLRASEVTAELLAAMPEETAGIVRRVDLSLGEGGELWAQGETGDAGEARFRVGFENASLQIGAPIESARGELTIGRPAGSAPVEGELRLETFEAAGAPMERGRATLEWDGETLEVPRIEAVCGGGAIRGRARLAPVEGLRPTSEYLIDLRASQVPLAWFIDRPEDPGAASFEALAARGLIGGRLTVRGGLGEGSAERVGRGTFAIRGGEVLRLPFLTPALELLNLQPPVGEQLDDAAIEFGLIGDRLVFDRLYVQSRSIVVQGEGEADLSDRTLDLWVRSRGRRTVPLLSELVNALRDELVATRVTGPITDPSYEAVQLPNTRRLLLGVVAPLSGSESAPTPAPQRPAMVESVPLRPEPIDE